MADAALTLRPAVPADAELLWEWRNDETARAMSGSTDPVAWEAHAQWFAGALRDAERHLLIVQLQDAAIGVIRFDHLGTGAWRASINLAAAARGHGYGTTALRMACQWLDEHERPTAVTADIRVVNAASARVFTAAGFRLTDEDETWWRYLRGRAG